MPVVLMLKSNSIFHFEKKMWRNKLKSTHKHTSYISLRQHKLFTLCL